MREVFETANRVAAQLLSSALDVPSGPEPKRRRETLESDLGHLECLLSDQQSAEVYDALDAVDGFGPFKMFARKIEKIGREALGGAAILPRFKQIADFRNRLGSWYRWYQRVLTRH